MPPFFLGAVVDHWQRTVVKWAININVLGVIVVDLDRQGVTVKLHWNWYRNGTLTSREMEERHLILSAKLQALSRALVSTSTSSLAGSMEISYKNASGSPASLWSPILESSASHRFSKILFYRWGSCCHWPVCFFIWQYSWPSELWHWEQSQARGVESLNSRIYITRKQMPTTWSLSHGKQHARSWQNSLLYTKPFHLTRQ